MICNYDNSIIDSKSSDTFNGTCDKEVALHIAAICLSLISLRNGSRVDFRSAVVQTEPAYIKEEYPA